MHKLLLLTAFLAVLSSVSEIAHGSTKPSSVRYQYPLPNSVEVHLRSNIIIRALGSYNSSAIHDGVVSANGSKSGKHEVELHLSRDRQVLIAHPIQPFVYNEKVHVNVNAKLLGGSILSDTFGFFTMRREIPKAPPASEINLFQNVKEINTLSASSEDTLPPITVSVDNGATPGTIYLANFSVVGNDSFSYLLNLDEHGNIIRKRKLSPSYAFDFKEQPNGLLTYYDYLAGKYYGMDTAWNIVDSFAIVDFTMDSYDADDHELRVFPDGGYALFAVDRTYLDPSQWAANIDTVAVIQGSVIEIFDADRNEIFEWRGLDHYQVKDAIHEDLEGVTIDFEHANSLDFDSSGNIILSNRNLSEITKIDGGTGDIIWRFGGEHNQFTLIGDSVWFSYQHAVRLLPNGHLTLFDNSNYDSVIGGSEYINESRAVEYALDTSNMTATLVWQWHHSPETFSMSMGYVDRLPNGNTLIGWGWVVSNGLAVTEVRPDNSTAFEMSMGDGNYSYRAIKYPTPDTTSSSDVESTSIESSDSLSVKSDVTSSDVSAGVELDREQTITLMVFDLLGRQVGASFCSTVPAGSHSIKLPMQGLPSGSYYCMLRLQDGSMIVRRFALLM